MKYAIQQLDDVPAIMVTWYPNFNPQTDLETVTRDTVKVLEAQPSPVFFVANLLEANIDFEGMVLAASSTSRKAEGLFHHPKVREVVFVTTNRMVEMGAKGVDSQAFGFTKIRVFSSIEEALDYVAAAAR
jgi:hypothetical protein